MTRHSLHFLHDFLRIPNNSIVMIQYNIYFFMIDKTMSEKGEENEDEWLQVQQLFQLHWICNIPLFPTTTGLLSPALREHIRMVSSHTFSCTLTYTTQPKLMSTCIGDKASYRLTTQVRLQHPTLKFS